MPPECSRPAGPGEDQDEQLIDWCQDRLADVLFARLATIASGGIAGRYRYRELLWEQGTGDAREDSIQVTWSGVTFARPELITIYQPDSRVIVEPVVVETMLVPIDDETEPGRA